MQAAPATPHSFDFGNSWATMAEANHQPDQPQPDRDTGGDKLTAQTT